MFSIKFGIFINFVNDYYDLIDDSVYNNGLCKFLPLMDIYIIARILRNYDTKERTDFNNQSVKYCVILTGDAHRKNYDLFFNYIDKMSILSYTKTAFQCIPMYSIKNEVHFLDFTITHDEFEEIRTVDNTPRPRPFRDHYEVEQLIRARRGKFKIPENTKIDRYRNKYYKYKQKYLILKNNIFNNYE